MSETKRQGRSLSFFLEIPSDFQYEKRTARMRTPLMIEGVGELMSA